LDVRLTPLRIATLYAGATATWILVSANIVAWLALPASTIQALTVIRGLGFVAVTAIVIWWLLTVAARQAAGAQDSAFAAALRASSSARTLRLVVEAGEAVLRAGTELELYDDVCRVVVRDDRFTLAWFGTAEPPPGCEITISAAAGQDLGYLDGIVVSWDDTRPSGRGPTGVAIRERRTVVINEAAADTTVGPWWDRLAAAGYASLMAVPFVHEGELLGVMLVYAAEPNQFTPDVVAELERVAGNVAFGVDRIRAREERIRARARVDFAARRIALLHEIDGAMLASEPMAIVAPRIAGPLRSLVGADRAVIATSDPTAGTVTIVAVADADADAEAAGGVGEVLPDEAIGAREGLARVEPTITTDLAALAPGRPDVRALVERGMTAGAVLPFTHEGESHGGLALYARDSAFMTPERLECAREVTDQLAIALRQERLRGGIADRDARLAAIVEASPNPIFTVSGDARVRFANPAAGRVFGGAPGALVGLAIDDLVPEAGALQGSPAFRAWFAQATSPAPEALTPMDVQARRLDGSTFPAEVLLAPISTPDGPQVIATVVDVSERAAFESRLRQAERLEVLGRFAGILAHDVRNFLTTIRWLAQALEPAIPDGHPSRPELDLIIAAGRDGIAMTKSVLEFARPTPELQGETDVAAHVEQLSGIVDRLLGDSVAFERDLAADLPPAQIAPAGLTQVLLNLATNARDAMPDGGTFRVAGSVIEIQPGDRTGVPLAPGRYVRLLVSDTGMGMDAATAGRVFEPFFTTKTQGTTLEGTGLGLASVFLIVGRLGGTITVESEPGEGTAFTVDLPVAE
jgi:PAS domain S-box-containing protein